MFFRRHLCSSENRLIHIWVNCAGIVRFKVKNKSEYKEPLSRAFDRAPSVVYESSIFPTVSLFVSEQNRV
jgi:hypothetical protein